MQFSIQRRLFTATAALSLAALAAMTAPAMAQTVTLRVGHDSPTDIPYHTAAEYFAERVQRETDGRVAVEIYPNAQLGDEATLISGLQIGAVDVAYTSISPISELSTSVEIFNLPFLFEDIAHALGVANGEIGDAIRAEVEPLIGARIVGWGSLGERDMWNSVRPITTVEDLRGLKMRIQQSAMQQQTYAALGALPTPISFSELYTSLQTGVVDGADNGPIDVLASQFHEVTDYLTLTHHFIVVTPVMISDRALDSLPEEDRDIVLAALADSAGVLTEDTNAQTQEALDELAALGLEIIELTPESRAAFVEAVSPVYDTNAELVGGREVIDAIIAGAGSE